MKKITKMSLVFLAVVGLTVSATAGVVLAEVGGLCYEVTVTNMTRGQVFTPVLVVTHKNGVKLFTPGEPASDELAELAESGNVVPLAEYLDAMTDQVGAIAVSDGGPFGAGESVSIQVPASGRYNRLSIASMLAITNDGFVALNGVSTRQTMHTSPVYDAGSEMNDELVAHIPGPGGEGYNEEGGEGFVHIHAGIHGIGDLPMPENLDWRNPAARVTSILTHCSPE